MTATCGINVWEFFKAFTGPIAVIIASGAATWITYKLGNRQAKTAEAQRDIAYDKLKHDLFDKRYEIYQAAKRLIEAMFAAPPGDDVKRQTDPEIKRLRLKLDEARFFFPPDTRAYCETIEKHVYDLLVASHAAAGYSADHPEQERLREQQANAEMALAQIYEELAKKFERDLSFDQLTKAVQARPK
jgi:hypothetical protein